MSEPTLAILDDLTALADITRDRLLLLLEAQELTVSELCTVLQLPQSTVSRHLKSLADAGWVLSRAEATSRLYTMATSELSAGSRQLWLVVREQVADGRAALEDHRRLQAVLAQRRSRSQAFFSSAAGQWDHLREELFGATFHLQALAGLLDPTWTVGDLGCGTGPMTAAIAPFVDRVIAVDDSPEMLAAARRRIGNESNVELRRGDLEALPISDGELDAAMLTLVLPYLPTPPKVLAEVARAMAGEAACSSPISCRTIASRSGSSSATSGSASASRRSPSGSRARASRTFACIACRRRRKRKDRACSWSACAATTD